MLSLSRFETDNDSNDGDDDDASDIAFECHIVNYCAWKIYEYAIVCNIHSILYG